MRRFLIGSLFFLSLPLAAQVKPEDPAGLVAGAQVLFRHESRPHAGRDFFFADTSCEKRDGGRWLPILCNAVVSQHGLR